MHYLSAPITPMHLFKLGNAEVKGRFKQAWTRDVVYENKEIKSLTPFSLLAPEGCFPLNSKLVTHNWHRTLLPSLNTTLKKCNLKEVSLLYVDNLSYHFLPDYVNYDHFIFRVMDIHEYFPGWKSKAQDLACMIASRADLTAYSAKGLKNYVDKLGAKKTLFVPNGVDFDFFQINESKAKRDNHLKGIPEPVFLYSGMIDSRLDFSLIRQAARKLPDFSFVFAGPIQTNMDLHNFTKNIFFLGTIPHQDLPELMYYSTAGIIPFNVNEKMDLIKGIRPLKLLEYMAAGLPVISARWPELETMHSPAYLYGNLEEFIELAQNIVDNGYSPKVSKFFAKGNDWKYICELLYSVM